MPQVIRAPLVVNKIEELRWLVQVRNESAVLHSIFRRLCWLSRSGVSGTPYMHMHALRAIRNRQDRSTRSTGRGHDRTLAESHRLALIEPTCVSVSWSGDVSHVCDVWFYNSLLPERALEEHWCAAGACGETSPPSRRAAARDRSTTVCDSLSSALSRVHHYDSARAGDIVVHESISRPRMPRQLLPSGGHVRGG